jgi:CheY-like chemotaxis protein
MDVLVVEDEAPKLARLRELLLRLDIKLQVREARSVKSGLLEVQIRMPDLLVLDMSLPTFDVGAGESGGRPQGFGGWEIIRYLDSIDAKAYVVVVTQYEVFPGETGTRDLQSLEAAIRSEYPDRILGVIHFSSIEGTWADDLTKVIQRIAR